MFLHVVNVEHREGYRLRLVFSNDEVREVDLEDELFGEVFEPLRDLNLFQQVRVNPNTNTIEWSTGADLAPEYLYEIGKEVHRAA